VTCQLLMPPSSKRRHSRDRDEHRRRRRSRTPPPIDPRNRNRGQGLPVSPPGVLILLRSSTSRSPDSNSADSADESEYSNSAESGGWSVLLRLQTTEKNKADIEARLRLTRKRESKLPSAESDYRERTLELRRQARYRCKGWSTHPDFGRLPLGAVRD
jgi:hypothetical protein